MENFLNSKELTLRECQLAALSIYERFRKICDELGLKHWVDFGSMIGAVRHNGFIPWDDDLDVSMPRPDYEILLSKFTSLDKTYGLYLDNALVNNNYPFYISRVCDNNYTVVFDGYNYKSGMFIDIYPYDGMCDNRQYWQDNLKKSLMAKKIMVFTKTTRYFNGKTLVNKIGNILLLIWSKIQGNRRTYYYIDKLSRKNTWEESEKVGLPIWKSWVWLVSKGCYDELIEVPFEGESVIIPAKYDEILKEIYGDYMKLPPVEKQVSSHSYHVYKKE